MFSESEEQILRLWYLHFVHGWKPTPPRTDDKFTTTRPYWWLCSERSFVIALAGFTMSRRINLPLRKTMSKAVYGVVCDDLLRRQQGLGLEFIADFFFN